MVVGIEVVEVVGIEVVGTIVVVVGIGNSGRVVEQLMSLVVASFWFFLFCSFLFSL